MVPGKPSPLSAGKMAWPTRTGGGAGRLLFSIRIPLELVPVGPEGTGTVSVSPRSTATLEKPGSCRELG